MKKISEEDVNLLKRLAKILNETESISTGEILLYINEINERIEILNEN